MGQYYFICNLDKREYIHPHKFDDGLKLLEFGMSSGGTMMGLAALLADGNGRGGGDLRVTHPIIGSWAGDRIVIAGDYADPGYTPLPETLPHEILLRHFDTIESADDNFNLFSYADAFYKDISEDVIAAISASLGSEFRLFRAKK